MSLSLVLKNLALSTKPLSTKKIQTAKLAAKGRPKGDVEIS
jgi:hypothetical protein